MALQHFYCKLIPPRPTFAFDMSDAERSLMQEHALYVDAYFKSGKVLLYGPVFASEGAFGVAILEMVDEPEVRRFLEGDPTVKAGVATFAFYPMKVAAARSLAC